VSMAMVIVRKSRDFFFMNFSAIHAVENEVCQIW